MTGSKDFNWADVKADIIVNEQPAIAVFTNPAGAVVLRQAGQYGMEDDHWVYFHSQHALAVAYAILDSAGLTIRDMPLPSGERIEQMEAARPDIDWPAVHHDFDAGEATDDTGIDQIKKPRDGTAAARQKRYREKKKRNARNAKTVTGNAETVTENNELQLVAAE